ncbi:hypothetical protein BDZ97DRAFT_1762868 [Flammula alnicola]|nr:hypothetical protein BDZ97DRAFT_1762868 [Flammula alnicola]
MPGKIYLHKHKYLPFDANPSLLDTPHSLRPSSTSPIIALSPPFSDSPTRWLRPNTDCQSPVPHRGGRQGAFLFPPPSNPNGDEDAASSPIDDDEERNERSTLRLSALEFVISLSEARSNMVRKVSGWTEIIVRACLEGMGEDKTMDLLGYEETYVLLSSSLLDLMVYIYSVQPSTSSPPALYEQSLDRLPCTVGGKFILPPAFQAQFPPESSSYVALPCLVTVMQKDPQTIVDMVTLMFNDSHPRVRDDACQLANYVRIWRKPFNNAFFGTFSAALIPAVEDPEPRVHSHAASTLINFCEGVERASQSPRTPHASPMIRPGAGYYDPGYSSGCQRGHFRQAIMPLLLSVLRNADGPDYWKLRVKAMECAGLICRCLQGLIPQHTPNTYLSPSSLLYQKLRKRTNIRGTRAAVEMEAIARYATSAKDIFDELSFAIGRSYFAQIQQEK